MRYYALEALVEASGLSEAALVRAVGMSGSTWKRVRVEGLSEEQAERYALRLRLHPFEVWTDFYKHQCAECDGMFTPTRKGHRFCSTRCYQNQYQREWRRAREASDPEFVQKRRDSTRAWRETARRTKRVKDRAYYQANADRIRQQARERYRRAKDSSHDSGEVAA